MYISCRFRILNLVLFLIMITYSFPSLSMKRARSQDFTPEQIEQLETPNKLLFSALEKGDLFLVQEAIKAGANVNAYQDGGQTPLHFLSYFADEKNPTRNIVRELLAHGANVNARDDDGDTPLHFVGSVDIAKELIAHGADVNAHNDHGRTPLHFVGYNDDGRTPLHFVGYIEIAKELINHGANINALDDEGNTPLMKTLSDTDWNDKAVWLAIVKELLLHGADVNIKNKKGFTALCYAVSALIYGNRIEWDRSLFEVAQWLIHYLIAAGADVNYAIRGAHILLLRDFNQALAKEYIELIIPMLATLKASGRGIFDLIFHAAQNGDYNTILNLLNDKFTLKLKDQHGNTPLHYAVRNNDHAVINIILQYPFAYTLLYMQDLDGNTPLHLVIRKAEADQNDDINMILSILEQPHGPKLLHVKNKDGHTPIHLLAGDKHDLLRTLLAKFFGKKRTVYDNNDK